MRFFLLIILAPILADAAPRVNNGGGVWVCKQRGEVSWIKATDFFELKDHDREQIDGKKFDQIVNEKIISIVRNNPDLNRLLSKWSFDFDRITKFVDFSLNETDDTDFGSRPQPEDCLDGGIEYEQIAVYLVSDTLLISKRLWESEKFFEIDKAAIYFHEWIYHALRNEWDEQTSKRTRKIVAWIFSGKPIEIIQKEISGELKFNWSRPEEEELARFPVAPRCEALMDDSIIGAWQPLGKRFGEGAHFSSKGFDFFIETSPLDGVPSRLEFLEKSSGWSFHLDTQQMRATYLKLRRVEVSASKARKKVQLRCWNQG